ncbi:Os10g0371100 [Oryza sativa Japonica Group]|uniref:Os10g0371100 protein n=1 Tax=Oryza sativa subsp. japonica TaxID=39947 RepID=C7J7U8_ORYSJ|nr:Os10g0371100 [Oryza sativa Japonica Group]|eukprot:NP_001176119.1 Os10g0371100 [Oryza sativa Japonica Group]
MDRQWRCLAAAASTSGNSKLPPLPMALGGAVEYGQLVHGAAAPVAPFFVDAEQQSLSPATAMVLGAGWYNYNLVTPSQAAQLHHRLRRAVGAAPCSMKRASVDAKILQATTTTTADTAAAAAPASTNTTPPPSPRVVKTEPGCCSVSEASTTTTADAADVSSTGSSPSPTSSNQAATATPPAPRPPPPLPETIQQLDFTEAPWDEADGFALRRYPSWEIDWDAILS